MTKLTPYGGVGEIGGNRFLLEDEGIKLWLDFGRPFNYGEEYFHGYHNLRPVHGLAVPLRLGLIERMRGLYSKEMLRHSDLPYRKPDERMDVLISHGHGDHVDLLPYLDPSIPVYMGEVTHALVEAQHKLWSSLSDIGEHDFRVFRTGDRFRIGHLDIEPVHVDHSIPGAYGYIIRGLESGPLVYTGDFRIHGTRGEMSLEFLERVIDAHPQTLMIEGTRMGREAEEDLTEDQVEERVSDLISKANGFVGTYFSMLNIDRFRTFYNSAVDNGKVLVIPPQLAFIVETLRGLIGDIPDPRTDPSIRVHYGLSRSGEFKESDYRPLEREYIDRMITFREIRKNVGDFVAYMNLNHLYELGFIDPKGGDFIYSQSEHFLEGAENSRQKKELGKWMDTFGIALHKAHCSGHAAKKDVGMFIRKSQAQVVVPMHTTAPAAFKKLHPRVRIPVKGRTMRI